jgi:proteic killer suppression protein
MLVHIKHKALGSLWHHGDASGIRPDWVGRVRLILSALHAARVPGDLKLPGLGLHALKGDRAGSYAVTVSRNWRITFRIQDGDAVEVDLEDYHG